MSSGFRKTWDKDVFEKLAAERIKEEDADPIPEKKVKRELLRPRDYRVDLDSKLGKSMVVTKDSPSALQGGYYCKVCDCVVKDSINYLDHINGKKHQRNLGMSMKVERSTLGQVKARLESNKRKLEEAKNNDAEDYDLDVRAQERQEEEERQRILKRQKKKDKKKAAQDDAEGDIDPDMAAIMGFGGFGGSSKAT